MVKVNSQLTSKMTRRYYFFHLSDMYLREYPFGSDGINVKLVPTLTSLEEVVVVGYSVQKKMDITGSVAVVDVDELKKSSCIKSWSAITGQGCWFDCRCKREDLGLVLWSVSVVSGR